MWVYIEMCSLVNMTLEQHRIFTPMLAKSSFKSYTGINFPCKHYFSHIVNCMNVGFFDKIKYQVL